MLHPLEDTVDLITDPLFLALTYYALKGILYRTTIAPTVRKAQKSYETGTLSQDTFVYCKTRFDTLRTFTLLPPLIDVVYAAVKSLTLK